MWEFHEFHSEPSDRVRDGIRQFDRGAFAHGVAYRQPGVAIADRHQVQRSLASVGNSG